jgi:hypothetical protein
MNEWFEMVQKLKPCKISIARDLSRSEPLPENYIPYTINYDTKKPWINYDRRHEGWLSDESQLKGLIILIEDFLKSETTHFLHIDSDVILGDTLIATLLNSKWDYLQLPVPVVPRESLDRIMIYWDSMNFGISKSIAEKILPGLKEQTLHPYPIDIQIHENIRRHLSPSDSHLSFFRSRSISSYKLPRRKESICLRYNTCWRCCFSKIKKISLALMRLLSA